MSSSWRRRATRTPSCNRWERWRGACGDRACWTAAHLDARKRPVRVIALLPLLLLLAAPTLATEPEPEPPHEHDPWQGMDRDGRIPAVEKPVKHPERWR